MFINIEDWLKENGYDLSDETISSDKWQEIENYSEQVAQNIVDEEIDRIGQEVVERFRLQPK